VTNLIFDVIVLTFFKNFLLLYVCKNISSLLGKTYWIDLVIDVATDAFLRRLFVFLALAS